MMETVRRIVVCEEPQRQRDLRAPSPKMPKPFFVELAARIGRATGLPSVAVGLALEHCELTDFVFYYGYWDAFVAGTPDWSPEDRRLRAHRTAHLMGGRVREYGEALDRQGLAFSIPESELYRPAPSGIFALYGRPEFAEAAGLVLFPGGYPGKHYVLGATRKGMSQEEMIARYLRAYWDKLGY